MTQPLGLYLGESLRATKTQIKEQWPQENTEQTLTESREQRLPTASTKMHFTAALFFFPYMRKTESREQSLQLKAAIDAFHPVACHVLSLKQET